MACINPNNNVYFHFMKILMLCYKPQLINITDVYSVVDTKKFYQLIRIMILFIFVYIAYVYNEFLTC